MARLAAMPVAVALGAARRGSHAASTTRRPALAVAALALARSLWWERVRLEALDRSVSPSIRRAARARRRRHRDRRARRSSPSALRRASSASTPSRCASASCSSCRSDAHRRRAAVLELIASCASPRPPEDGFDERAGSASGRPRRRRGGRWRLVGRRGGVGGWPTGSVSVSRGSMAPASDGRARRGRRGDRARRRRGALEELRDAFRASGLYHLLAVSGQNVALVARGSPSGWLLGVRAGSAKSARSRGSWPTCSRSAGSRRWCGPASRASSSRSRGWSRASATGGTSCCSARLALLAWNPYDLRDPGFQLSLRRRRDLRPGSACSRRLEGYPVPRSLGRRRRVAAACERGHGADPLVHFHAVPLLSVPANALAARRGAILGLAPRRGRARPGRPPGRGARGWLNGWSRRTSPGARASSAPCRSRRSGRGQALLALVALAAVLFVVASPRERARRSGGSRGGIVAARLVAAFRPRALPPPRGLRVTFLDVGQGDAIAPAGAGRGDPRRPGTAGGSGRRAVPRLGVRRLSAARPHAPAARPRRRGGRRDPSARRRPRARSGPSRDQPVPGRRTRRGPAERGAGPRPPAPVKRSASACSALRVLWPDGTRRARRRPERNARCPARLVRRRSTRSSPPTPRATSRCRSGRRGRDPQGRAPRLVRLRLGGLGCSTAYGRASR